MPVYLQLEGEMGFPHEGVIDFVDNTFNASTGTLQIRGHFQNKDASLYPDAFIRIRNGGNTQARSNPDHGSGRWIRSGTEVCTVSGQ